MTFWGQEIYLLHTIEGDREDSQKVLVAICTLEYFFLIIYFNFGSDVFLFLSSLEPLFFSAAIEHIFRITLQKKEKYSVLKMDLNLPYFGATRNHDQSGLELITSTLFGGCFLIIRLQEILLKIAHRNFGLLLILKNSWSGWNWWSRKSCWNPCEIIAKDTIRYMGKQRT